MENMVPNKAANIVGDLTKHDVEELKIVKLISKMNIEGMVQKKIVGDMKYILSGTIVI
jgi:hypothetical protein